MQRYSESFFVYSKRISTKRKLLKSKISGLWFLSHHSGGFDLSHEVSISISWWSLLCSSGRRERCECGTGLRSIKAWWELGWTCRIGWCHMSSWSWIMIQTHVVCCLGDLLFELRFTTFQTAKQLLWWEILLAPLTASTPDIKQNSLEIPGALIFVEILLTLKTIVAFHLLSSQGNADVEMQDANRFEPVSWNVKPEPIWIHRFVFVKKWCSLYCWWKKSCTTWDGWNPINNGIIIILGGAGFCPSTVGHRVCWWQPEIR